MPLLSRCAYMYFSAEIKLAREKKINSLRIQHYTQSVNKELYSATKPIP